MKMTDFAHYHNPSFYFSALKRIATILKGNILYAI